LKIFLNGPPWPFVTLCVVFCGFIGFRNRRLEKNQKIFVGTRCPSAAPISSAVQRKIDRALSMRFARRCRLRAIHAPLGGLFFLALTADNFDFIAKTGSFPSGGHINGCDIHCERMRAANARKRAHSIWNCTLASSG
jgi:hypothetical protein